MLLLHPTSSAFTQWPIPGKVAAGGSVRVGRDIRGGRDIVTRPSVLGIELCESRQQPAARFHPDAFRAGFLRGNLENL